MAYSSKIRLYVEPDSLHCQWNDLKNAYKRADLQAALLLGVLLSQTSHGPFLSATNQYMRQQVAELLSESMDQSDFDCLREAMLKDRYNDATRDFPESPRDIPELSSIQSLSIFAL